MTNAIRERLDEEGDYYPEDGDKLVKCYTDSEKRDTKENYDLEQYLADYILQTLEILNTCIIAQDKVKYVDRNNEDHYERSREMNEHKKEEISPAAAIEEYVIENFEEKPESSKKDLLKGDWLACETIKKRGTVEGVYTARKDMEEVIEALDKDSLS